MDDDDAGPLPGTLLSVEDDLARQFEVRLVESSTLAFEWHLEFCGSARMPRTSRRKRSPERIDTFVSCAIGTGFARGWCG